MNLKEYLDKKGLRPGTFARAHNIFQSIVHKHIYYKQPLSLESAIKISDATDGEVSIKDLWNYSTKKNGDCQKD